MLTAPTTSRARRLIVSATDVVSCIQPNAQQMVRRRSEPV